MKKARSTKPRQLGKVICPAVRPNVIVEDDRIGMSSEAFKRAFLDNLYYIQGSDLKHATPHDAYMALSYTMRDRLMHRWIKTRQTYYEKTPKAVYYLSSEFLMGRQLGNNLLNTCCFQQAHEALREYGLDLYDLIEQEPEPGLGNGGLGRLAACFLDSLATLEVPATGYGIRYEFGIFRQGIEDGWQVEHPDRWLSLGNPWEIHRPQLALEVKFGGSTEPYVDADGAYRVRWIPARKVLGVPYDTLVPGFGTATVNTLRLWSARATNDFDFQVFDAGDYNRAVEEKTFSENISKVLYPNDNTPQGRELRLRQQFFFTSCSIQDVLRIHLVTHSSLDGLHLKAAVQLNDTHPSIAVAELMRLLVDEHQMPWDKAWDVTRKTLGYTNHTLLPEALETWPMSLFGALLPRHLEIVLEINHRFLDTVRATFPDDPERLARMSIVQEGREKRIRMANLATIGSHSINGVAALHTELVKKELLRDFYEMWPERFSNKTNGVTPRRWMMLCNPKLTFLITEKIGKGWIRNLEALKKLEAFVDDPIFRETWRIFKSENKNELAEYIKRHNGIRVNPNSLFDVQVKRLHEYKRQLLMVFYIITIYNRLKADPSARIVPRTFIFGAKAAPGYHMAKLIIKLINSVGAVVNNDPDLRDQIKVVFLENFCVSLGERVYPAADLSEQISTAGMEASGTGNMKFAMNGALTIGTLDGANIEIREAVGEHNFFLFGLTVDQVRKLRQDGYCPSDYYRENAELRGVVDALNSGVFSAGDGNLFRPITDALLYHDTYNLFADYQAYVDAQARVSDAYGRQDDWTRMSIMNVARMAYFSSDRTIREYCEDVWDTKPLQVVLPPRQGGDGRDGQHEKSEEAICHEYPMPV